MFYAKFTQNSSLTRQAALPEDLQPSEIRLVMQGQRLEVRRYAEVYSGYFTLQMVQAHMGVRDWFADAKSFVLEDEQGQIVSPQAETLAIA